MGKMKTLKKWNLIINLLFIFILFFSMNILPYRIIINRHEYASEPISYFRINIPKFFGNYKYFKIILKEVSCDNRNKDIWLNCDASTYNQISQHAYIESIGIFLDKFLFNLTAFREGSSQSHYVILPYRDTLKFWITNDAGVKPTFDVTATMIIELEPYEI